ncbi:MAG: hypothetical protein JWP59_295 [Massilia sp.]|jgi:parallel beta-helix repeat protein|nr:hypothetical protein [Massilia sp.]
MNTKMKAAITILVIGAVGAAQCAAQTVEPSAAAGAAGESIYHLYVSPGGSDSANGSQRTPFRTIAKAASVAKPSTTVHVAPGLYGDTTVRASGTATGRVRYVSDEKWRAKIVGTGNDGHFINLGNYVDIVGFDVSGSGRLGIVNFGSFTSIEGNHVHHVNVSSRCSNLGGAGIVNARYTATDDDIIGNVVHDIGVPGKCNSIQGIYHGNMRGKILNNVVYRVSAWGIHLWHAASNVTIANNTVFQNGGPWMGGGIEVGNGDSPGGIVHTGTTVANNVVYDNPGASIQQYCYPGVRCIGGGNVTVNNLVYRNGRGISLKTGSASGTVDSDPQFVNYRADGGGDYRLRSSSPAVDRGSANGAPRVDIDGRARPLGRAVDLGAYENY